MQLILRALLLIFFVSLPLAQTYEEGSDAEPISLPLRSTYVPLGPGDKPFDTRDFDGAFVKTAAPSIDADGNAVLTLVVQLEDNSEQTVVFTAMGGGGTPVDPVDPVEPAEPTIVEIDVTSLVIAPLATAFSFNIHSADQWRRLSATAVPANFVRLLFSWGSFFGGNPPDDPSSGEWHELDYRQWTELTAVPQSTINTAAVSGSNGIFYEDGYLTDATTVARRNFIIGKNEDNQILYAGTATFSAFGEMYVVIEYYETTTTEIEIPAGGGTPGTPGTPSIFRGVYNATTTFLVGDLTTSADIAYQARLAGTLPRPTGVQDASWFVISGGGTTVVLSTDLPKDVVAGAGIAGTSSAASRSDHVHGGSGGTGAGGGGNFRGAWDREALYNTGDVVTRAGGTYQARERDPFFGHDTPGGIRTSTSWYFLSFDFEDVPVLPEVVTGFSSASPKPIVNPNRGPSAGTADSAARSDHIHAYQSSVSLGGIFSHGAGGLLSLEPEGQSIFGSVGNSLFAARANHGHRMNNLFNSPHTSDPPEVLGTGSRDGNSSKVSRHDHVHGGLIQGTTYNRNGVGLQTHPRFINFVGDGVSVDWDGVSTLTITIGDIPLVGTRYIGWSTDQTIAAIDFDTAATSDTNTLTAPTVTENGYIWFAVPQSFGYPTSLDKSGINQLFVFTQQTGTVNNPDGAPYIVGVSNNVLLPTFSVRPIILGFD